MKASKLICVIALIALFGMVRNVDWQEEEGVLVLTDDNFDHAVKHYEHILVEFYAPWCGHCKKLAPEYAKAAQELKNASPTLALAKVDATIHKGVASRFEIRGFPTLKLFSSGTPSEYNGGRTQSEIVSWMKKKTGPASRTLSSVAEVESFHNGAEVAVVYFGDNAYDLTVFERVAKSNDDLLFATCASEECFSHFGVQAGTVVLFKKFDEGRNDFTESLTDETLRHFLSANSSPLVMKFDEKAAQLVFGKATPGLFFYRDANSENTQELDNILRSVAKQVQGKIQVILTDIKVGLETRLAEYIGVTANDLPSVRIHDTRNDLKKFNMEGAITEENILNFLSDWENGRLRPHLKSEEIPDKQEGDVYVLVGKSFHQIVMDPTKDVLVEFYAPWCGHCKKLEPIYNELAQKFKSNSNVVIAKMDATLNEVEEVSIQGFPTIKYWAANNKNSPIDFDGDRTLDGFVKFLEKHSTAKSEVVSDKKDDL
jgi:protein disulfide-isomerase A1